MSVLANLEFYKQEKKKCGSLIRFEGSKKLHANVLKKNYCGKPRRLHTEVGGSNSSVCSLAVAIGT